MIKTWIFEFFPELQASRSNPNSDLSRYFSSYQELWAGDEARGFNGVFFSEHHFGGSFGPSPNLLIAAIASRTRSLRLGVMGVVTSLYAPWRIVEEIGMLDQLTGGRLEIGTAVGIPQELARVNMSMAEARERNDEAVQFLDAALASDTITFRGKYFCCENLRLLPRPVQSPSPPKWTTVVSADSARKAARRRSKISTAFNPTARIKEIFDAYRDEADRCGFQAGPDDLALRRRVVVAGTQSEARELSAAVDRRVRAMLTEDPRAKLSPTQAQAASGPIPDAAGPGFTLGEEEFISGVPGEVAEQIIDQCRHIGAGHFLNVLHWGASFEEVSKGHDLFGREVLPLLNKA